jgi:hypothetical protein
MAKAGSSETASDLLHFSMAVPFVIEQIRFSQLMLFWCAGSPASHINCMSDSSSQ